MAYPPKQRFFKELFVHYFSTYAAIAAAALAAVQWWRC